MSDSNIERPRISHHGWEECVLHYPALCHTLRLFRMLLYFFCNWTIDGENFILSFFYPFQFSIQSLFKKVSAG